jgi:AcrR family transcriptional regulator
MIHVTVTPRTPRKDQLRNRQRLLDAARAAFAEQGPALSIETIARRAGVGATTFYRHFPTKEDLAIALIHELTAGAQRVAAQAAEIADDWSAFEMVFTQGCVLDQPDLRLFDILCRTSPRAAEEGRTATAALIAPATERARRAGLIRRDIGVDEIAAFMRMADSADNPDLRRTTLGVLLAGLAAEWHLGSHTDCDRPRA